MTANEFLSQLERRLKALPETERKDALEYYEGYIADAEEEQGSVIKQLGSPAEVAAKILAEYATAGIPKSKRVKKSGLSITWSIILGVFAVPIALPLAIAVVVIAIALLIVICSLIIAFGITAIATVVAGIGGLVAGTVLIFTELKIALMLLGISLVSVGFGLIFTVITYNLTRHGFWFLSRYVGTIILRRRIHEKHF